MNDIPNLIQQRLVNILQDECKLKIGMNLSDTYNEIERCFDIIDQKLKESE